MKGRHLLRNTLFNTTPLAVHAPGIAVNTPLWPQAKALPISKGVIPKELDVITWNSGKPNYRVASGQHELGTVEASLDALGANYTVLGSGVGNSWINRLKIATTVRHLSQSKHPYTLGADSSDVRIFDLQGILDRFKAMQCKLLFNAEHQFWPKAICGVFETGLTDSPYKSLNAGLWVGETAFCLEVFRRVYAIADETNEHPYSEQVCVKKAYPEFYPDMLADYNCEIFQNLNRATSDEVTFEE